MLAGYYVYFWHCNATGNYSQYSGNNNSSDFSDRTFLRGVGVTDANDQVTFTTIFPRRYTGRATHIHFQLFPDNTPANGEQRATSQLAFPPASRMAAAAPTPTRALSQQCEQQHQQQQRQRLQRWHFDRDADHHRHNSTGYVGTIKVAVAAWACRPKAASADRLGPDRTVKAREGRSALADQREELGVEAGTAVDLDGVAGDEGRRITEQKHNRGADLGLF